MALFSLMDSQKTLVFLHGWGVNSKIFEPLFYYLKDDFEIYAPDLPGFGAEPIERVMALKNYSDFVYEFLIKNKIKKPVIIGHSFGGAVAAKLALIYPENLSKLILVSASIVRRPRLKIRLLNKIAESVKIFFPEKLRKFILKMLKLDKTDYAQIYNHKLKETFKKVINEDLSSDLSAIKIPTLVIWGDKDTITPIKEGELIARLIPNAKLSVIKNVGHFKFLEKPQEFIKLLKEFAL